LEGAFSISYKDTSVTKIQQICDIQHNSTKYIFYIHRTWTPSTKELARKIMLAGQRKEKIADFVIFRLKIP
jgi:hypothetical protein